MHVQQYGPENGPNLVCLLGWGNRLDHEPVRWLLDRFVAAGYRVHAFEIPTVVTDIETDYIAPVAAYTADLDGFRLVGHSTGGLIAAFVEGAHTTTYLSPFWGFPRGQAGLDGLVRGLLARLPLARRVLPVPTPSRRTLGRLTTDRQLDDVPSWTAPTFLREVRRAHRDLPPIDDDAVVFCTLADGVVSVPAIGRRVPADRTVLYDGGHELFGSASREAHVETLLSVVEAGASGLDR